MTGTVASAGSLLIGCALAAFLVSFASVRVAIAYAHRRGMLDAPGKAPFAHDADAPRRRHRHRHRCAGGHAGGVSPPAGLTGGGGRRRFLGGGDRRGGHRLAGRPRLAADQASPADPAGRHPPVLRGGGDSVPRACSGPCRCWWPASGASTCTISWTGSTAWPPSRRCSSGRPRRPWPGPPAIRPSPVPPLPWPRRRRASGGSTALRPGSSWAMWVAAPSASWFLRFPRHYGLFVRICSGRR